MTDHQREKFEAAVVERLKESGLLEIEIRTYANSRNAGRVVAERLNIYQYDADL